MSKQSDNLREQRAKTSLRVDQAVWDIWTICRLNKDSLDSERQCKRIRAVVDLAVADIAKQAEELAEKLTQAEEA